MIYAVVGKGGGDLSFMVYESNSRLVAK